MKTPEQIADEHIWRITDAPDDTRGREWIRNQIITAIEADRAQRRIPFDTLDRMLNAWENYDGDVSGFMEAWLSHFNEGADVPEWAKA